MFLFFSLSAAFGFCDYADPEAGLRAIRLLHDLHLGDKSLVVSKSYMHTLQFMEVTTSLKEQIIINKSNAKVIFYILKDYLTPATLPPKKMTCTSKERYLMCFCNFISGQS